MILFYSFSAKLFISVLYDSRHKVTSCNFEI